MPIRLPQNASLGHDTLAYQNPKAYWGFSSFLLRQPCATHLEGIRMD